MFAKAFRVKSNTAIKGSDRRKLRADVAATFPALSAEQLSELVSNKEELNVIKLYAHRGDAVTVYANSQNPVLFEMEKSLYPTVYALWSYPDLLPAFATWPPVLQKLAGGADLMLPGVVVPSCGLPQVQKGTLCAITLAGNRAPVAIGIATMSTAEMLAAGMKGRGLTVLHTYTDHLWGFGDKSSPPTIAPMVADPAEMRCTEEEGDEGQEHGNHLSADPSLVTDFGNLGLQEGDDCTELGKTNENGAAEMAEEENTEAPQEAEDSRTPQEQMDELLHQCFLHALKCKVKKSELPLLTSTFLRNHMFSCCIRSFVVPEMSSSVPAAQENRCSDGEQQYHPPEIVPLYGVTSKMAPLFLESGHKKGSLLFSSDVRNIIINYVKNNELVDETNKNFVKVNPILCDCLLDKAEQDEISKLKWDDLVSRCLERLQLSHQLTFFGHEPITRKGNIDPIDITIAQRSSNKKVTIIKNLEVYGLDPQAVANILQQRVQASATLGTLPGAKDRVQVQIQGNQINHLAKLLLEEYRIPRKYIQGLEKAPKLGRKK
uniref:Eukaryotic translation initiation factor 2D n=1 Tax=Sphenodon punctatus TaxID=8508 RepID=A0A8D0GUD5_SPHPU